MSKGVCCPARLMLDRGRTVLSIELMKRILATGCVLTLLLLATGCRSAYYATWEKFGKYKRDLLRENVQKVRDDQQAAAEQFKDALTRLKELYRFEGGDLEKVYDRLKAEYDRSNDRAEAVRNRIRKVEQISSDLFTEWDKEAKSITNTRLRADSEVKLRETQRQYESLHAAMKRAEGSMDPVLTQLRDQVTYLKHNLNAQAIGALKGEALDVENEIQKLIQDMNSSISEAEAFIKTLP
jgi:DNA repair exonuclease SbcCD ATPase subunit